MCVCIYASVRVKEIAGNYLSIYNVTKKRWQIVTPCLACLYIYVAGWLASRIKNANKKKFAFRFRGTCTSTAYTYLSIIIKSILYKFCCNLYILYTELHVCVAFFLFFILKKTCAKIFFLLSFCLSFHRLLHSFSFLFSLSECVCLPLNKHFFRLNQLFCLCVCIYFAIGMKELTLTFHLHLIFVPFHFSLSFNFLFSHFPFRIIATRNNSLFKLLWNEIKSVLFHCFSMAERRVRNYTLHGWYLQELVSIKIFQYKQ